MTKKFIDSPPSRKEKSANFYTVFILKKNVFKVKLKSYIKAYFKLRQTYQHSQNNEKSLHVYDASLIVKSELVAYTHHPCIYTKHCGHLIILRSKDKPIIPERP